MTVQSTGISEHPRLFATSESIARLKKTVGAGTPKWLYDRLIEQCQHHVAEVDLKESRWSCAEGEKGGLTGFWENPREILDMSLGYLLTDDDTYRDLAVSMIEKMTAWETWFHRYEPDRGVMLQSMAMAYDLMYDALGPDRAQRLRERIVSECDDMLGYLQGQGQQHKHSHNTGGARTFSAFGIAVMSIQEACEHAEEWLALARDGVACWIEAGLDEDGGTRYMTEGSYNVTATGHVTAFVIAYRNVFGRDPCDLSRLRNHVLFSLSMLEPQRDGMGQFGVFGRAGTYAPETMLALMALFDDGLARWFYDQYYGPEADLDRFCPAGAVICSESCYVLPLLYWKEVPAEAPDTSSRLKHAALFRGSGKAVMRTGFEDPDDLQLMVQCQSPQHGHSQAEVGNFILNALGERFIDDPGCASGSPELRSGAWGSYVWGCSPGAHNLVLIDGVAGGTHSFGTIPDFLHSDMADYLLAEMKPAYDARSAVRRAQRHVVFVRPSYFVIIDDVRKDDQPHDYELLLHAPTHRPLNRTAGENQFLWRRDRADLLVAFAHPRSVSFAVPTAELVAEQAREGDSKDWSLWPGVLEKKNPLGKSRLEKQDHLDFLERMKVEEEEVPPFYIFGTGEPGIEGLFFTLLYPVRHGNEVPSAAASSTAAVVSMTIDGRDLVAFNRTGGAVEAGEVKTDAAVFHTRVEEGRMAHWFAARATMWRHAKTGLATTESITASFQGVTGRVVAARETPLTITYPGIQGMELDGTPVHGPGLRENEMTIRLPAGEHGLRIVTDRGEAYFRERE